MSLLTALSLLLPTGVATHADSHDVDTSVLTVDVSKPFKDADHAASGSLYGLGDEGWPSDEWIGPTKPKMVVQPPPGATHPQPGA